MNDKEALKLALEALGLYQAAGFGNSTDFNKQHEAFYKAQDAIIAIKQARSATVQEPVAWDVFNGICHHSTHGTESSAKAMAAEMQKNHDLSGSIAAFNVKPRIPTPPQNHV